MYWLREAESSDFEFLLRLKESAYRRHVEELWGKWDPVDQRARLAKSFTSSPIEVIEVGGEAVGSLSVDWDADPVFLGDIALVATQRGQGIGTRVVHYVLTRAQELGRGVRLQVLRPNPARELYERLGFKVTGTTETHVQMAWNAKEGAEALQRAMEPWTDPKRRDAWLYSVFDSAPTRQLGFIDFIAGRHELGEALRVADMGCGPGRLLRPFAERGWRVTGYEPDSCFYDAASRVAATVGEQATVIRGGFGELRTDEEYDLIVCINGPFSYLVTAAQREQAAAHLRAALRPGGTLVIDSPNFPWILRNYEGPGVKTVISGNATVSRIPSHEFDFHDGVLTHEDLFVVEVDNEQVCEVSQRHLLGLFGFPEIQRVLTLEGFANVETFTDLDATQRGRVARKRVIVAARR